MSRSDRLEADEEKIQEAIDRVKGHIVPIFQSLVDLNPDIEFVKSPSLFSFKLNQEGQISATNLYRAVSDIVLLEELATGKGGAGFRLRVSETAIKQAAEEVGIPHDM